MSNSEKQKSTPLWKRLINLIFLPMKLPSFFLGCFSMAALFAIVLVIALYLGFANNLLGGLDWLNQLMGAGKINLPANIYVPEVERVQALSQLTTSSYNYADVQAGQRNMPAWLSALYGDSVVMVTVGIVEAGIDVSQITQDDIIFDEESNTLNLTLPYPTLQSCFLDERQSYVVQRSTAAFGTPMNNLEDTIRQRALLDYRDRALEEGILDTARSEADTLLREFLGVIVGEGVTINLIFEAPLAEPVLPATCQ